LRIFYSNRTDTVRAQQACFTPRTFNGFHLRFIQLLEKAESVTMA
jgi:hypothetical protein